MVFLRLEYKQQQDQVINRHLPRNNVVEVETRVSTLMTVSIPSNSSPGVLPSETGMREIMKSNIKYPFLPLF